MQKLRKRMTKLYEESRISNLITIEGMLKFVQAEDDPFELREPVHNLFNSYYNMLCSFDMKYPNDGFNHLKKAVAEYTLSLYKGRPETKSVKETVKENEGLFLATIRYETVNVRHLMGVAEAEEIRRWANTLQTDPCIKCIDEIVSVSGGGNEPAMLLQSLLGKPDITIMRFSHYRNDDRKVVLPKRAGKDYLQHLKGKNVLVVEDWIVGGKSIIEVMKICQKSGAKEIYGTSIAGGCPGGCLNLIKRHPMLLEFNPEYKEDSDFEIS